MRVLMLSKTYRGGHSDKLDRGVIKLIFVL